MRKSRGSSCSAQAGRRRARTLDRSLLLARTPGLGQDSKSVAAGSGNFAANGAFLDNLEFADRDKERTFIDSIVSGPAHNQIAEGVETALSCILGRMAGYQNT